MNEMKNLHSIKFIQIKLYNKLIKCQTILNNKENIVLL